jgi:hypothetical protein
MVGIEPRFITLEEAQSMETRIFIAAAATSLRARGAALGVTDVVVGHNEAWFRDRSEQFTLAGARAALTRGR